MAEPHQIQIVGPVMTNTDNPWRQQGDYREEQREARERHAMFQEQHRLLLRSFRLNYILILATVIASLATAYTAFSQSQANAALLSQSTSKAQPNKAATKESGP